MYHTLTCKQRLNKATAIYQQGYTVYLSIKNYINIAHCHKMHWCQLPKTSQKHKVHRIIYLRYLSWIGGQRTSVLEWKIKALSSYIFKSTHRETMAGEDHRRGSGSPSCIQIRWFTAPLPQNGIKMPPTKACEKCRKMQKEPGKMWR